MDGRGVGDDAGVDEGKRVDVEGYDDKFLGIAWGIGIGAFPVGRLHHVMKTGRNWPRLISGRLKCPCHAMCPYRAHGARAGVQSKIL